MRTAAPFVLTLGVLSIAAAAFAQDTVTPRDRARSVSPGATDVRAARTVTHRRRAAPATLSPTAQWTYTLPDTSTHFGTSVAVAGDVNGDGYSDLIVGAPNWSHGQSSEGRALVYYGGPSGFAATPGWTYESNSAAAKLGTCVAPAGDVNGDGYADVIVGAPGQRSSGSLGFAGEGRAYLFLGSATGLSATPAWTRDGGATNANLGIAACPLGDFNGDGYDDVAFSATGVFNGTVFIFFGGPAGLPASPSLSPISTGAFNTNFGVAIAGAGDVNGDGRADLVIGAPLASPGALSQAGTASIYLGVSSGASPILATVAGTRANQHLGSSVAIVGDLDGDGFADIALGIPGWDTTSIAVGNLGAVLVCRGGATGITMSGLIPGPVPSFGGFGGQFGTAVAAAGDVNGDGFADFAVGAPIYAYSSGAVTGMGYVAVYEGTRAVGGAVPAVLAWSKIGSASSGRFGAAVAAAGDGAADGFGDLAVGAPNFGTTPDGQVQVFRGEADMPSSNAGLVSRGGVSIGVGDVDGDGFSDLVKFGRAGQYLQFFTGGAHGLSSEPMYAFDPATLSPGADSVRFAQQLGDINGDGYDDVEVFLASSSNPAFRASVLLDGSASGPSPAAIAPDVNQDYQTPLGDVNGDGYADVITWATGGDTLELHLGSAAGWTPAAAWKLGLGGLACTPSVAGIGDFDGDGFGDVVVAVPCFSGALASQGEAQLFLGYAGGLRSVPAQTWLGVDANDKYGGYVEGLGDVNGDGFADFVVDATGAIPDLGVRGEFTVHFGGGVPEQVLVTTPVDTTRGVMVVPIHVGDVNGDGYDDMECYLTQRTPLLGPGSACPTIFLGSAAGFTIDPAWSFPHPVVNGDYIEVEGTSPEYGGPSDFNGDGFADVIGEGGNFNKPADSLQTLVFYGNARFTNATALDRAAQQRRADDTAPVARLGVAEPAPYLSFRLAAHGRSAAGRTRVRMQSDIQRTGLPFAGLPGALATDPWSLTGPSTGLGSFASLSAVHALPATGPTAKWRMRIASASPYFPWTPWLSAIGSGRNLYDVRTSRTVLAVPSLGSALVLSLAPPAPNPTTRGTRITFSLPTRTHVELGVFDLAGRRVATLANGPSAAGPHALAWDGTTASGHAAEPGVYFVRLTAAGDHRSARVVIAR